jgi:hypothetical protein
VGDGLAADALADPGGEDFAVVFRLADGIQHQRLGLCWSVPFEHAVPVRAFASYRGQKSFSGWWWAATTGLHVGYESWLERDHLMLLDFDPDVVGVAAQPFWLHWREGHRERRHAPDYFVRLGDGSAAVIDVRPDDRIAPKDAEAFAATARACAQAGWCYRRVGAIDPVLAANVRWLSGYRHARCHRADLAERLRADFAAGAGLLAGARAAGDPIVVLPVLFHLLWSQELLADRSAVPLGPDTVVRTRGAGGR